MSEYRLIISPEVFEAWDAYVEYIAVECEEPLLAERWMTKSWRALQTLKQFPHRCPPAPENESFDFTVRVLIVDRCLFCYRVVEEEKAVRVFSFRHGSQLEPGGE